jgi:filamentous hemagglutinin
LNDGDCTNEAKVVAQASQNASQTVQGAQNTVQVAQSVWQMNPFDRGVAIENMLGRTPQLAQNFTVIDRFQNGIATSIKSIDLMAKSYQSVETLTRTVQGYINALANWQGARWGGVTIQANQIAGRELILAIPPNASQAQLQSLQQLQQWAFNQGVTLTLTTVK